MILNRKYYQFRQLKLQTGLSGRMKPLVKSTQSRFKQLSWNVFHKCRNQSNNTLTVLLHNPLFKSSNNCSNSNGRYNNCNIRYTNISSQEQSENWHSSQKVSSYGIRLTMQTTSKFHSNQKMWLTKIDTKCTFIAWKLANDSILLKFIKNRFKIL